MELNEKVKLICEAAADKKANNIAVIDISKMSVIADKFIICSAQSSAQVKAICDNIEEQAKKQNEQIFRIDGYDEARWIIVDFSDVLVHIFKDEDRIFYNLEHLWNNGENMFVYTDK